MSTQQLLVSGIVVLSAILVLWWGPRAVTAWRIYSGIGRRRQRDATQRAPAAPPDVRDRMGLLEAVSYRPLGVTALTLPNGQRFAWILAADDGDSYAILARAGSGVALTGIYSAWIDGTWLCTHHPVGASVDRAGLHIQVVPGSLADAVTAHRTAFERLRPVHGPSRQIRSMPDMLALDADYRVRFGGSRLRGMTLRIVAAAAVPACVLVAALALLFASR